MRRLILAPLLALFTACSPVPELIRNHPTPAPALSNLLATPDAYQGQVMRLGGVIAGIVNTPGETRLEIVARRLLRHGEPRQEDRSEGRFMAIVPEFLDPAIHAPGRQVTLIGQFTGIHEQPLGEMPYRYPQLQVSVYYLWPIWRDDTYPPPLYGYPWYPYGHPSWPVHDPFWNPYWYPYPW